jgi:hypothetical protein
MITLFLIIFSMLYPVGMEFYFGDTSPYKVLVLSLGSSIPPLILWQREASKRKKAKKAILKQIKSKLKGDKVFLTFLERSLLGIEMKEFTKQPGSIQNSTGNQDILEEYKISEEMLSKLQDI